MTNFGKSGKIILKNKFSFFLRRNIWNKNVQMIEKHNLEADLGLHTYTMKVNQFADLLSLSLCS